MTMPLPETTLTSLTAIELKEFMDTNGVSVKEMSEVLGVTDQAIKNWLQGTRNISITVTKIVRMFKKYPQLIREF